jgi:hypothetical protein
MSACIDKTILWNIGIKPEVERLLDEVNPEWRSLQFITVEFYLDPIEKHPDDYKFLAASRKHRQKWYVTHYLLSVGWKVWTPNHCCINPNYEEPVRQSKKVKSNA